MKFFILAASMVLGQQAFGATTSKKCGDGLIVQDPVPTPCAWVDSFNVVDGGPASNSRSKPASLQYFTTCYDADTDGGQDNDSRFSTIACGNDPAFSLADPELFDATCGHVHTGLTGTTISSNQVNANNCFMKKHRTEGDFDGWYFGHRNSGDTSFTYITVLIQNEVRGVLKTYCGTKGQAAAYYAWMASTTTPTLCGSGYCNAYGSAGANGCRKNCDALVAANCVSTAACDLTSVTCSTSCTTFSSDATCNQDCAAVQTANVCKKAQ